MAATAWRLGEYGKAELYARESVSLAQDRRWGLDASLLSYWGHQILGLLALRRDDVPAAVSHLHEAGRSIGGAVLRSVGPSMLLASELLHRGEREAVRAHLRAWAGHWAAGDDRLEAWQAALATGGTPDFRKFLEVWP